MPYPAPGTQLFGIGPPAGPVVSFLRNPQRAIPIRPEIMVVVGGSPVEEGMVGIRFEWRLMSQDQFAQLQKAVELARSTHAGYYRLQYWDRSAGSPAGAGAVVERKGIPLDPEGTERGPNYLDITWIWHALEVIV